MSFVYLWVLLLIPVVLFLLRGRLRRTSLKVSSVGLWTDTDAGRARYLWIPVFLRRLALMLLLVALARPQAGSTYDMEVSEGIAIQLLVDVSSSMDMNVRDLEGKSRSRMDVAKEMVERFIAGDGDTLDGRGDDLLGLITFARYADTRSPLTFGHDALLQIVRGLDVQERPNEDGTAYGDALALAAARLHNIEELQFGQSSVQADAIESRVIILLTDGENNSGAHLPLEAAGLAKEWGCRIYCISLGDTEVRRSGEVAVEDLTAAEKTLKHISDETGGIFRQASDYESLLSVYEEIDRLERSEISTRSYDHVAEWFWLPLGVAILSLLGALILEATVLRVVP
ncbi:MULTISPECIES: VWA domain-containing protein [unclassified Lentimonas]|uniref:VWA domain-containing protein n=1 Tax=unclassified Lentimonas TaxID=2630993 RepID=UPI0013206887|nr:MULTISPECIES: VWA domain-containing protein [unclassified Lentimonas]CAA6689845.1 BatA (Bacteroides aerotolerance operon) [Lentimonas sp. CC10]CAA6697210.1 BatA (Bacteroides aerotolerance operon) [Lentimonas sp. CC19]CAA7069457.1 BatA (Bacteroides aerotolerance operon) [Lentimonas sp. CC11]